jgi:hypothetical protein
LIKRHREKSNNNTSSREALHSKIEYK